MKKLMFAALVAVAAVSAHANTLLWGINPSYKLDDTKFANATAYLMYSTTAIAAADLPKPSDTATSYSTSDLTVGSQLLSGTVTAGGFEGNTFVDSPTGKIWMYLAVISDDGKNMAISTTTKTATISTGTGNTNLKWLGTTQMNVYTAAPEPTSGLLMLVGLGALALRRRRA